MRTSGILRKKLKITELLSWRIQVWFQIILIHSATSQTSKRGAFRKLASSMLLWGTECPFLSQRLVLLRFTSSQGMRRAHVGVCTKPGYMWPRVTRTLVHGSVEATG